jgi:hypothetical protein
MLWSAAVHGEAESAGLWLGFLERMILPKEERSDDS